MKRAEQLGKTRQAILRTATRLFLQNGFSETSTRDIAKLIGITQPALYHHFSDKEVLYLEVMTNLGSRVRSDINRVIRKHDLKPAEQLWQITELLLKYHPESIYEQMKTAMKLLSPSSQKKMNMLIVMDYIEPIGEFFKQQHVNLRADILPNEAAELYLAELTPAFGTFQAIGGSAISDTDRAKLILDCILNGLNKR